MRDRDFTDIALSPEGLLTNLIAVIDRDGGHAQIGKSLEESVRRALDIIYSMRTQLNNYKERYSLVCDEDLPEHLRLPK